MLRQSINGVFCACLGLSIRFPTLVGYASTVDRIRSSPFSFPTGVLRDGMIWTGVDILERVRLYKSFSSDIFDVCFVMLEFTARGQCDEKIMN